LSAVYERSRAAEVPATRRRSTPGRQPTGDAGNGTLFRGFSTGLLLASSHDGDDGEWTCRRRSRLQRRHRRWLERGIVLPATATGGFQLCVAWIPAPSRYRERPPASLSSV